MAKKKKAKKKAAVKKAPTKSEIYGGISEKTGLSRKEVASVFDELEAVIKKNIGPRGGGAITIPGLCKLTVKKKPATKARPGVNPFTGEKIMIKAKPARKIVKIRPLKKLKEMA